VEDENLSPAIASAGSSGLCVCFEGTKETQRRLGLGPDGFDSSDEKERKRRKKKKKKEEVRRPHVRNEREKKREMK